MKPWLSIVVLVVCESALSAPAPDVPLSQVDLGASVLAEVDNARAAIDHRDPVAATNDIAQALAFVARLPDRPSRLIPQWSAVLAELTSAQAELPAHLDGADAQLRDIQRGIPAAAIPRNLPLLRAAASLDLAAMAAISGRTAELRTQLQAAQAALRSYAGPGHVPEARALAETIGRSLAQPPTMNTMLRYPPRTWLSQVLQWAGAERWRSSRT